MIGDVRSALRKLYSRSSLWPRMAIGLSGGFLIVFVAFGILAGWAIQDATARISEERQVIALMAASQIDALLDRVNEALLRAVPEIGAIAKPGQDAAVQQALRETYDRVADLAFGVVQLDSKGRVVRMFPTDLQIPAGQVVASPPFPGDPFALPLRAGVILDRDVLVIAVGLASEQAAPGALAALIDPRSPSLTRPLTEAARIGQTGHAVLIDGDGRILASTFDVGFLSPGEHVTFYRRAAESKAAVVDSVPFEIDAPGEPLGHLHLMAYAPVHSVAWGVATGGDLDEATASVRRLRIGLIVLGGLTLFGVWAVTLLGTRLLVAPVRRLTASAEQIAAGSLDTPLYVTEGGEIGGLAAALEHMRAQLLANIEKLNSWNEALETRVAERTIELRQQEARTRQLLRGIITAQEEERRRLSRELHDDLGQILTAIHFAMERCFRDLPDTDVPARRRMERAQSLSEQAIIELRRMINALRPGILDRLGLAPALEWVADHMLRPNGLDVTIEIVEMPSRLPEEIETVLFRIAQEALSNVIHHSEADRVSVRLEGADGQIALTIRDNGKGFVVPGGDSPQDGERGFGLAGMRERASLLGGRVEIESRPNGGTRVTALVPYSDEAWPNWGSEPMGGPKNG